MKTALLSLVLLVAAQFVQAEVTTITFSAIVKSFDNENVVCEVEKRTLSVKRTDVLQRSFRQGDPILVVVAGRDIASVFKTGKK